MSDVLVRAVYRLLHWGGRHFYISTGCLHGGFGHSYCRQTTGRVGAKDSAQCKFCPARCRCRCHKGRS